MKKLQITIAAKDISVFTPLLAEGFTKEALVGVSLFDLLVRQMGMDPTYLNDRVQTIFLNGRAVDDISRERVSEGDVIALSAAMPGLAGAVFRKGGILSSMRSLPVPASQAMTAAPRSGRVVLKLFNLVARELGPDFLEAGVRMEEKRAVVFLKRIRRTFEAIRFELAMDDRRCGLDDVLSDSVENGEVLLFVRCF